MMKVKELIEILSTMPEDAEVLTLGCYTVRAEISEVTLEDNGTVVLE